MEKSDNLFEQALAAYKNAYAPYSHFQVGAAILTKSGNIFTGCNVENVSYPCGTCAEAGAISAMVAAGEREIAEILILADTQQILPCGNCLQKIAEFSASDVLIHSANPDKIVKTMTLSELLPLKFQAKDIENAG